jgi:hypothetical protein
MESGLSREEHLKFLAEKFEKLNKDFEAVPSEENIGVLNNLLGNIMKMFKTPATENTKLSNTSTSLEKESPLDLDSDRYPPELGTCQHPGKVLAFAGASCYSNNTVMFYFMDSRKFWNYALAFGVRHDTLPRVALVLVDSQVRTPCMLFLHSLGYFQGTFLPPPRILVFYLPGEGGGIISPLVSGYIILNMVGPNRCSG